MHFPSDISLVYDSIRKSLELTASLCTEYKLSDLRQYRHNLGNIKKLLRLSQKSKLSNAPNRDYRIKLSHRQYIKEVQKSEKKIQEVTPKILAKAGSNTIVLIRILEIDKYMNYLSYNISLIERRIFNGETIPNSDKIHSVFQPHTRWISKGKAGIPVELGLPVAIAKDQHGYILDYYIMETESDVDVAVPLLEKIKKNYGTIRSASFDKGFWSKQNRQQVGELVQTPIMPKKGKLNKEEQLEHSTEEYRRLRKDHSSVESAINGLNHMGMDKCYDHGIFGFKRWTALSILARNIHTLGANIQKKQAKRRRRKPYTKVA